MSIEIKEVKTKKQLSQFIDFAYDHYKSSDNYVPELYISHKWMLTRSNPFFGHSETAYYLAYCDNKIVGRIAAIYNKIHLEIYNDDSGFFGFFESINNHEVAKALFDKAFEWLRQKGLKKMVGPTNLTTNDSCGILIEGFDNPPVVLMPYNMAYYNNLILECGFSKIMDLYSYAIDEDKIKTYQPVIERCQNRLQDNRISIRHIDFKKFEKEILQLRIVYNKSNERNWGFIPLNEAEFKSMAYQLKLTTPKELALVAEKDGKIIGFIIAVPDLNQALIKLKTGRLLPFGIIKLLWYKRKITKARILLLGILQEYCNKGLDLLLYQQIKANLNKCGIYNTEACYVLESNKMMNSIIGKLDGTIVKKYRMYQIEGA